MSTLCVIILTKNEEKDIEGAIQNAWQCADEVLVVDSGSTDRTVEIAEQIGASVVYRAWDNDFAAQRNFALTQTKADRVLYLDADERLNGELVQAVKKAPAGKQYSLQRKSIAFGTKFDHGPLSPDWVARLFPRDSVRWVGKVHEHPECSLPLVKLPGHIEHHTYGSWQEWENKMSRYSSIWAEEAWARGKRTSLPNAFLHGAGSLVKMLFLRCGFLDGWQGVCLSCMYFNYTMLKYLKLYELQQGKNR